MRYHKYFTNIFKKNSIDRELKKSNHIYIYSVETQNGKKCVGYSSNIDNCFKKFKNVKSIFIHKCY